MAIQRISTKKDRAKRDAVEYNDSQIEHYLFLLIYSGRHDTAESLFGELRRMLPGVDPIQLNRVAHSFAAELKGAGLE
ncbi:hypothetical protein R6258_00630 [Halomonas sp. HP20-15]|uniref:hypothetical protein n=1 Tax=Halomonas sp. HP20-15 TaxID=3085901 RepID=UPI0029822814|nr:hypothetical protein [Halomonas sp. HP20-15]MDW5375410.1 hypothetical protein [Halomonas sp. HP20-15]